MSTTKRATTFSPAPAWVLEVESLCGSTNDPSLSIALRSGDICVLVDAGGNDEKGGWGRLVGGVVPQCLLLTHAHPAQISALLALRQMFPGVVTYATQATIDLIRVELQGSGRRPIVGAITAGEATSEEISAFLQSVRPMGIGIPTLVATARDGTVYVTAANSGHTLGSVAYLVEFFASDGIRAVRAAVLLGLGTNGDRGILGADIAGMREWRPDVVVWGGPIGGTKESTLEEEAAVLYALGTALLGGGTALIPSASAGAAQRILFLIRAAGKNVAEWRPFWPPDWTLPPLPVWIDGTCREGTLLYETHRHLLRPEAWTDTPFPNPLFPTDSNVFWVRTANERARLASGAAPCVILTSIGLEGRGAGLTYARSLGQDATGKHKILLCGRWDEIGEGRVTIPQTREHIAVWDDGPVSVPLTTEVLRQPLIGRTPPEVVGDLMREWRPRRLLCVQESSEAIALTISRMSDELSEWGGKVSAMSAGQRFSVAAPEKGGIAWPLLVGQQEWGLHWLVGRLLDHGEAVGWHGHATERVFRGEPGGTAVVDGRAGGAMGLPPAGGGPEAIEYRPYAEAMAARSPGGALHYTGALTTLGTIGSSPRPSRPSVIRSRLQATIGRGVRPGGESRRLDSVDAISPGDLVLGTQCAPGARWVFPAIVLQQRSRRLQCFAPQSVDPTLSDWQVIARVGRWPLWRGEAVPPSVTDWALLDRMAVGFQSLSAGGESASDEGEVLSKIWEACRDGHLPIWAGTAASILIASPPTTPESVARLGSQLGEEGRSLMATLNARGWGEWKIQVNGELIWAWGVPTEEGWPTWPDDVVRWLRSGASEARSALRGDTTLGPAKALP